MNHVMLDLETLGVKPGAMIVSIGAVAMTAETLGDTFYRTIQLDSGRGLQVEPATLSWWLRQPREAQSVLTDGNAKELIYALDDFERWLNRLDRPLRVWGNGATFDPPLLEAAFRACGWLTAPWGPFDVRCYRTLKSFSATPAERRGTHHHALDDALTQARHLQTLLRELHLELT